MVTKLTEVVSPLRGGLILIPEAEGKILPCARMTAGSRGGLILGLMIGGYKVSSLGQLFCRMDFIRSHPG